MATISISQLDTATQAKVDDLYEVAVVDENSQTGYASRNLTAAQIATLFAQVVQFSGLSTEAKTIIAAINEAAQNGGTEVEANPAGEPTDTLETIGIDGTVYEVGGSSEPVSKTATGNPIHIEDAADAPVVSGEVTFEPKQDLHGYNKPWAGGSGKNKCDQKDTTSLSVGNLNLTSNGTFGSVTANKTYTFSFDVLETNANTVQLRLNNVSGGLRAWNRGGLVANTRVTSTFTVANDGLLNFWANSEAFTANTKVFDNIQLEEGSPATAYEPYSNICPIEGYTDCEIEVTDDGTTPTVTQTYTIDLDGTRYGGKVYPVTGKMSVGMGRIASYNGESIGEPWLSDRDEYVQGTTPSIGAEVVYTLATPLTVQLTPEQIRTLQGTNNISTNMTNMSLEYITQDYQSLVKLIERSAGHHYSAQERVVGTWIDGKPLYEKVFSVTLPTFAYEQWTVIDSAELTNVSELVTCKALKNTSSQQALPTTFAVLGSVNKSNKLQIMNLLDVNYGQNIPARVIVRYTKTTD